MKTYAYRGYTFKKSRVTTGTPPRRVYEVDRKTASGELESVKSPMTLPALLTVRDCKDLIDELLAPPLPALTKDQWEKTMEETRDMWDPAFCNEE